MSVDSVFRTFLSHPLRYWLEIWYMAQCTTRSTSPSVSQSFRLSVRRSTLRLSTRFSELFSAVLWDIDLKFGIWLCLDMIQIKFAFCHGWPTFTLVIVLCKKLVFQTFLSRLLWYQLEIWYMNLSWHNTDQVRLLLHLTYSYISYCPLLKFKFLFAFEILTLNFTYGF